MNTYKVLALCICHNGNMENYFNFVISPNDLGKKVILNSYPFVCNKN